MGQPFTDPNDTELVEFRRAQQVEYGTWVAATDIYHGTAMAYRAGDPVPVSNVERHGYVDAGLVVKRNTKAGAEVLDRVAPDTADPVSNVDDQARTVDTKTATTRKAGNR